MRLEVLVSMLNGDPRKFVKKAKIDSDAVIINQCDEEKYEEFIHNGHTIRVWHTKERGVSRSRNMALMKSTADIVLFADDDEVFESGYSDAILNAFQKNRRMDFAVFDIRSTGDKRRVRKPITRLKRIHWWRTLRYGTVRFAVRREKVLKHNIRFSSEFGMGCKYTHGEDNIFLHDCIKSGFLVFAMPYVIATIDDSDSTWFHGKDEQYYRDTGALYGAIFSTKAFFLAPAFLLRNRVSLKNGKAFVGGLLAFDGITSRQALTDMTILFALIFFLCAYCIGALNLAMKGYYPIICLVLFSALAMINRKKMDMKFFVVVEAVQLCWAILCVFITGTGIGSVLQIVSLISFVLLIPYIKVSKNIINILKWIIPIFMTFFFFSDKSHLNTNFIGFIYLASYVMTVLIYSLYRKDYRITRTLITIIYAALIFFAKSRASLVGVAVFYMSLIVPQKKWNKERFKKMFPYIVTIGSILFAILYVVVWKTGFDINFRFFVDKGLFSGRNRIWNEMLPLVVENPIFGVGSKYVLRSFPTYAMHNTMLMITCTFGLPNLCLFIAALRHSIRERVEKILNCKSTKLFLVVLLTFFMVDFFESYIYWTNYSFMIFVIVAIANGMKFGGRKAEVLIVEEGIDRVGGVERIISVLANRLANSRKVEVISFDKTSERPFFEYGDDVSVKYLRCNYAQGSKKVKKDSLKYYLCRVKEIVVDDALINHRLGKVFDEMGQDATVICGRLEVGVRVSRLMEDERLIVRDAIFYDYYNCLRRWQIRKACRRISILVVSSEESKKRYDEVLKNGTEVIKIYNPLGVDPDENQIVKKRKKLLLAVGRASEQKNFQILIDAFKRIEKKYPDWRLRIVGPGVEAMYGGHVSAKIELRDSICKVEEEYHRAAIYVMPSRYEGYANSLVEAMSFAVAPISFDWMMGADEIIPNEKTGVMIGLQNRKAYAEGGNFEEDLNRLAEGMASLMGDSGLRDEIARNARKYILKTRNNERIMNQWEKIIDGD